MPASSLDFRASCGSFLPVFMNFMWKRAKAKADMNIRVITLRSRTDGVLFGFLLCLLYMGPLINLSGDVELNPGPKNLRQTRLTSSSPSTSDPTSPPPNTGMSDFKNDDPSLKDIMSFLVKQNTKIDNIHSDVKEVKDSYSVLREEFLEMKETARKLKDENDQIKEENSKLTVKVDMLERKVDDLECRSKRNNIIVHGIPRMENENTKDCDVLLQKMLRDKLDFSDEVRFDRVHRLGARKNAPIIACCTFFKDKIKILKEKTKLKGTDIFIGEDFSSRVRDVRKRLSTHLANAKKEGKKASMIFDHLIIDGKKFIIDNDNKLTNFE